MTNDKKIESLKNAGSRIAAARLLAILCIAVASGALVSCTMETEADEANGGGVLHVLDDRIRLLDCRLRNIETRAVFGEPAVGQETVEQALEYDEESIEHDEESIEHDEESIEHDEESIEHDEESIEHDEESIEHDEESIEHDEESIEHDEGFKNLVSCRRDTLDLRKKYLYCANQRRQCIKDGGAISKCNQAFVECAAEVRKSE